jgi:hypothetical protein
MRFGTGIPQSFGQNAFDLRDFAAQGKNGLLRPGGRRHGVHTAYVPIMFQWIPEESSGVKPT